MNKECELCGEEKELCKRSHIIPNFMYRDLFDEKGRMNLIQTKEGQYEIKGFRQSGEKEGGILCPTCDNERLGKLERYASLILYGGYSRIAEPRQTFDGLRYLYCADLDYTKFKLFLLSILWRASISSKPLFREVSLGPYEDEIRQMILSGDPGEQMVYPCLIMTYLSLEDLPSDLVTQPSQARVDGGYVYKFLIGGLVYVFFVTRRITPEWVADVAINQEGEMKIVIPKAGIVQKILSDMTGVDF